jgi:DNA-directed RNA polymerase specialized sigma24 family protein
VSEDRRQSADGEEELYAAFAALDGPLTRDELRQFPPDRLLRLLGSAEDHSALVRQASLLLGGDIAAAETVVQDSFAALQDAWSRLGDLASARLYLRQSVVRESLSVRRRRRACDRSVSAASGAGHEAIDNPDQGTVPCALRALPDRQLEAIVLCNYMGLSEQQAAAAMGISTGAVSAHLARGMASAPRPPSRNDPGRSFNAST